MSVSLLGLTGLSYGLLIPWLGFYWDDWYSVWIFHARGAGGLIEGFSFDRPFLGWLYAGLAPILGEGPLAWQAAAFFTLWLGSLAYWWCLRSLWPDQPVIAIAAAPLFALYPAFAQRAVSWAYVHVWIQQIIFLVSLGAMALSVHRPQQFGVWRAVAVGGALLEVLFTEYFTGLELLRLPLLWWLLGKVPPGFTASVRWRKTLLYGWPFLAVLVLGMIARGALLETRTFEHRKLGPIMTALLAHPIPELGRRLSYVASDMVEASLIAWARPLGMEMVSVTSRAGILTLGIMLLTGVSAACYWWLRSSPASLRGTTARVLAPPIYRQLIGLGLVALVFGLLPIWLADRQIEWSNAFDRHSIPAAFGACLLMVGLVGWLTASDRQWAASLGVLVMVSSGFQFYQANEFRRDWARTREFAWQLSWRIPQLAPGTSLFVYQDPPSIPQPKDYALALPLNFVYGSSQTSGDVEYWAFTDAQPYRWLWFRMMALSTAPRIPGQPQLERTVRNVRFSGLARDSVVVVWRRPGCLRVLDATRDEMPHAPALVRSTQLYSNLDRIQVSAEPAAPPANIFGPPPTQGWCYTYQNADLARQAQDWEKVARLGDQARAAYQQGMGPMDGTEWLPFVEAYLRLDQYKAAGELLFWIRHKADEAAAAMTSACRLFDRVEAISTGRPARQDFITAQRNLLLCGPPATPVSPTPRSTR